MHRHANVSICHCERCPVGYRSASLWLYSLEVFGQAMVSRDAPRKGCIRQVGRDWVTPIQSGIPYDSRMPRNKGDNSQDLFVQKLFW